MYQHIRAFMGKDDYDIVLFYCLHCTGKGLTPTTTSSRSIIQVLNFTNSMLRRYQTVLALFQLQQSAPFKGSFNEVLEKSKFL